MHIIKNATLYTMDQINGENGYVAIENGTIREVGRTFDPERFKDATITDAKGKVVTPGLVDPHCHLGIHEEGIMFEGNDTNEMTAPITPELRGLDSVYPADSAFKTTRESGVTTVITGPGSANAIGGTFTALKTAGETVDAMMFKEECSMKMALGENPKRVYSSQKKTPSTRMATAALIREWLMKARDYHEQMKKYEAGEDDAKKPSFDMKLHSLSRVFSGLKVKIHAHRSDDIMTAIRIAKEFNLDASIEHATEAHLIADSIKESGMDIILGPTLGAASKYELVNKSFKSAKILDDHKIPFAIMTDHPVVTTESTMVQLALFVKHGLSKEKALQAVTTEAARINGVLHKVGSLESGKDADVVIWDGDPFDIMSRPEKVYIDGQLVHEIA
ncbi:MAG: amidohydrolase [Bacillota bacterium]